MVRKKDLSSLRQANRRLVLSHLAQGQPLSRTELAERTGLSASTISTIVSGLVADCIVHETGDTASTGGRERRLLDIDPTSGAILIVEVRGRSAVLTFNDMSLAPRRQLSIELSMLPNAGEKLFNAISRAIEQYTSAEDAEPLVGIGLLVDEQTVASFLTLLYSTGFDEASIGLRQALMTRFKVPVLEESIQECSARELVARHVEDAHSWAYIAIGPRITLSIAANDKSILSGERNWADLTESVMPGVEHPEAVLSKLTEESGRTQPVWTRFLSRLGDTLTTVVSLIPLDVLLVSGEIAQTAGFTELLANCLKPRLHEKVPHVIPVTSHDSKAVTQLANNLRTAVLTA